ncbi:MAG: 2-dehydropantoate 2-reductase [Bacillota bacterium]|nr:2-dehydropantoate 2-reductase [Bacillota bacterium]
MKIGIIGGGSIGMLFAALLSDSFPIVLYTRTVMQSDEINKNGIVLIQNGKETRKNVSALPIFDYRGTEDLTLISVKQYQLEEILEMLQNPDVAKGSLAFLQNGMSHLKLLSNLEHENIIVGSVEHGAYRVNAFTVRHNGIGATRMAVFKGNGNLLSNFAAFAPQQFPLILEHDYYEMLLKKLIANAIINPLTALLGVENGQLIENQHYLNVFMELFEEIATVLNLKNRQEYINQVVEICRKTAENRSSMLKDIEAKRRTEVDAILGYILEEALKQGKKVPLSHSLFHFVKGKEIFREGFS